MPNCIVKIAESSGRKYITPEDVAQAFEQHANDPHMVRIDLLEILGGQTGFGAEDQSLCAFIGFRGN